MSGSVGTIKLFDLRAKAWSDIIHIKESEKLIDFKVSIASLPSVNLSKREGAQSFSRKRNTVAAKHSLMGEQPVHTAVGPVQSIDADIQMHSVEVVAKSELLPEILDYMKIFEELQKGAESDAKQVNQAGGNAQPGGSSPSLMLLKLNVKIDNCFVVAPFGHL